MMSELTAKDRILDDCEALNAFAGRKIEYVEDLAQFAKERGMEPHEVLEAARRMDDEEVERKAEAETTERVACLVVPAGTEQRNAQLTTFDIFQDGKRTHQTRLVVTDTDGHDAWLDLDAADVERMGEWLIREGQRLLGVRCEQVSA